MTKFDSGSKKSFKKSNSFGCLKLLDEEMLRVMMRIAVIEEASGVDKIKIVFQSNSDEI